MDWYTILKDFAAPVVALCGVIATTLFAFAGLRTFDRWKREKLEEKRIDVAIDALAIAYEAQLAFEAIRSRLVSADECADMKVGGAPAANNQRGQHEGPRAVLRRVAEQKPFFDKVLSLEPKFVAVFGKDKDTIFERLFSAR